MATTGDIMGVITTDPTNTVFQGTRNKPVAGTSAGGLIDSFGGMFQEQLGQVDNLIKQSEELDIKAAAGQVDNLHDVMIAQQKAKIALDLTIQVRNFLMSAYDKLVQMR